jgi:hypothetical protein
MCSPIPLEAPVIHTTLPARQSIHIKYFIGMVSKIYELEQRIFIWQAGLYTCTITALLLAANVSKSA